MRALDARRSAIARWDESAALPETTDPRFLLKETDRGRGDQREERCRGRAARRRRRSTAEYTRPYIAHAAIGPSCAVARCDERALHRVDAQPGHLPAARAPRAGAGRGARSSVVAIHVDGAGCYGHNGADDVALDAALLARAVPGPPGARAVDARGRIRVGAVRPGDGGEAEGRSRRRRQHRQLGPRTSGATRHSSRPERRRASTCSRRGTWRKPFAALAAAQSAAARRRQPSQRDPALRVSEPARDQPPGEAHAGAGVGAARAGRAPPTCSRSNRSWTSWPPPPAPTRSSSGCGT